MNQIETLKWIAENGNPIGTEVESDYVKYKTDPTFRNLAMSLASSETGYAGLDDSTKNAYQTYKQSVETQSSKLPSLPEVPSDTPVDYSFVGFANPTTLPKAQKAASQVMAEQEPGYFSSALNYAMKSLRKNSAANLIWNSGTYQNQKKYGIFLTNM